MLYIKQLANEIKKVKMSFLAALTEEAVSLPYSSLCVTVVQHSEC